MNARERDMIADRQLRNAALALVKSDIANVKDDLSVKGLKDRVTNRLADGAVEVFEEATQVAGNNRGALATLLAAVAVWFARNPILSALGLEDLDRDSDDRDSDPDFDGNDPGNSGDGPDNVERDEHDLPGHLRGHYEE